MRHMLSVPFMTLTLSDLQWTHAPDLDNFHFTRILTAIKTYDLVVARDILCRVRSRRSLPPLGDGAGVERRDAQEINDRCGDSD
jgi:hypothetical protein